MFSWKPSATSPPGHNCTLFQLPSHTGESSDFRENIQGKERHTHVISTLLSTYTGLSKYVSLVLLLNLIGLSVCVLIH